MKTLKQLRMETAGVATPMAMKTGYFDFKFKVKPPKTAAQLESLISEYVRLSGGICTKVSVMGRQTTKKTHVIDVVGRKNTITDTAYIPSTTMKGTSDLIISYKKSVIYVEIKFSKSDRLSDHQKIFRDKVEASGAPYRIVKTLEEFEELFSKFMNYIDKK